MFLELLAISPEFQRGFVLCSALGYEMMHGPYDQKKISGNGGKSA